MPFTAAAHPVADVAAEQVSRPETSSGRGPVPLFDSIAKVDSDAQPAPPASPAAGTTRAASRDSIRNGLLIGAAVAAAVSILGTRMADCPDGAEECPGTKALGIALTVATGAAIGAGIDLLFAVDAGPGRRLAPAGMRRDMFVAGRIKW
jgi:hypothetical protein